MRTTLGFSSSKIGNEASSEEERPKARRRLGVAGLVTVAVLGVGVVGAAPAFASGPPIINSSGALPVGGQPNTEVFIGNVSLNGASSATVSVKIGSAVGSYPIVYSQTLTTSGVFSFTGNYFSEGYTYHYIVTATSSLGTTTTVDRTFLGDGAPVIKTSGALPVGGQSGTEVFLGTVQTYAEKSFTVTVITGSSPNGGGIVTSQNYTAAGNGSTTVFGQNNPYLIPGSTYWYQITVSDNQGSAVAPYRSFVAQ